MGIFAIILLVIVFGYLFFRDIAKTIRDTETKTENESYEDYKGQYKK